MNSREFEQHLKSLEVRLDRLKSLYEQYFQGFERIPPVKQRDMFERDFRELRRQLPNNTALRFRYNTLRQRIATLRTHWNRVVRQIEEGTYRRHIQKAKRRQQSQDRAVTAANAPVVSLDVDIDNMEIDAALAALDANASSSKSASATFGKPSRKPPPPPPPGARRAASKPPPLPGRGGGNLGDAQMKRIYREYVEARRRNNQSVDSVKMESLERSIRKMMPKLKQKHAGKKIDFEVVVKNGRVGLKPVPK